MTARKVKGPPLWPWARWSCGATTAAALGWTNTEITDLLSVAGREQPGLMGASVGSDSEPSCPYLCAVQEQYWKIFAESDSKGQV